MYTMELIQLAYSDIENGMHQAERKNKDGIIIKASRIGHTIRLDINREADKIKMEIDHETN